MRKAGTSHDRRAAPIVSQAIKAKGSKSVLPYDDSTSNKDTKKGKLVRIHERAAGADQMARINTQRLGIF